MFSAGSLIAASYLVVNVDHECEVTVDNSRGNAFMEMGSLQENFVPSSKIAI